MEIRKKAYRLNLDRIINGYEYSSVIAYSETRGKAKEKIAKQIDVRDYVVDSGEEMNFLNMPIKRSKNNDVYEIDGVLRQKYQFDELELKETHNNNLNKTLNDESISHCFITKGGLYYRDGYCGYSDDFMSAGVYNKIDAVRHARNLPNIIIVPIDVQDYNNKINDIIENLKSKIILYDK